MRTHGQETQTFTAALDISVLLKDVLAQAEEISLQAMNARANVAKAGDRARSIRPIVDYAEELSADIVRLVERIGARSMTMTRCSLEKFTNELTVQHFRRARMLGAEARHIATIEPAVQGADQRLDTLRRRLDVDIRDLGGLLDQIETILLAANIVVAKFHIEVEAGDPPNRSSFEALVKQFENAVTAIRQSTARSKRHLRTMTGS